MPKPHELLEALPTNTKLALDIASLGTIATTLIGWLPNIAAALSIAWLLWQMYDRWRYGPKALRLKSEDDE